MNLAIEGIWKRGKIIPLEDIMLDENTKVIITINEKKKYKRSLAGTWKNYRTKDGKTIEDLKNEIYHNRQISTRKEVTM